MSQKCTKNTKIIVVLLAVVVILGSVIYLWQYSRSTADQVTGGQKIFEGDGFTFSYPANYVADSKGLWTADGYQAHIKPAEEPCSTCQIPAVEVKSITTSSPLDQQIMADFDLAGKTLQDATEKAHIPYEAVSLGDNEFIKITVSDLFDTTGYYTKHGDHVVAFLVYWSERDNSELRDIVSTLNFK